ncbi:DASH family cryptochrome [Geofilum rhodophaeum]|uniref:DASH family cryptochrome n=1 Tax=Geofilum rhodophaeum TaxID=1965019 RepID=UPI000B52037B|nr:DASH family cryptochrome [Geofilum rhodophaeum]
MKQSPLVFWFRNDLRLHDQPALCVALDSGRPVLPIYIWDARFDEEHPLGFARMGPQRRKFLEESLQALGGQIAERGGRLLVFKGKVVEILQQVLVWSGAEGVVAQREYAWEELIDQAALARVTNLQLVPGSLLFTPDTVPFSVDKSPFYYTAFKNKVLPLGPLVQSLPEAEQYNFYIPGDLPAVLGRRIMDVDEVVVPTYEGGVALVGGESAGRTALKYYLESGAALTYDQTRNYLEGDHFSSRLSPWLANGSLSPRLIWKGLENLRAQNEEEVASLQSLREQLLWRDNFRYLFMRYGGRFFWPKGLRSAPLKMFDDKETFERWRLGETGEELVDALMHELNATGFMSNRGRMLVAYHLSKVLQVNWQWGAAWFENRLVDYEVYNNYGNWAYQSGRGTDSRVNRRFNLQTQAKRFDPDGGFVRRWGKVRTPGFQK